MSSPPSGLPRSRGLGLSQPSAGSPRQQSAMPLIGFVHGSAPVGQYKLYVAAFIEGLKEEGFEDRQNIRVEYRWAEGEYERVPALVAELLALKPKMVVAYG